jgi:hypothetical protein
MTFEELDKKFQHVIDYAKTHNDGKIITEVAATALTLLRKRVIETGVNAKGEKFAPYSTKPMLANRTGMFTKAYSQIAGSKSKRKELKWVTINGHKLFEIPGGYKQYRELNTRQTNYVDFSFTNRMWNNIQVRSKPDQHMMGIAIIGAVEEKEKQKLAGNTKLRGDILDLSMSEQATLLRIFGLEELKIFKESGL